MIDNSIDERFRTTGYHVYHWTGHGDLDITVLHKEPFRFTWFATQLVTFVFLIRRPVENYSQLIDDYPALRKFAGEHKQTFLPFGIQCGYALLPIYIGQTFPTALMDETRTTFKKRWCVAHIPSLLDVSTGNVVTFERWKLWGCVYRDYVRTTVHEVADIVLSREKSST